MKGREGMTLEQAITVLTKLPESRQKEAINFIRLLASGTQRGSPVASGQATPSIVPPAVPSGLRATFGVLSEEEADEMERVINECFEQIDPDEWNDKPGF